MACCGKPSNCSTKKQEKELPADALLESFSGISVDLAAKLLTLAASGLKANTILRELGFSNTKVEALAKRIADLAIENEYLRKVTDLFSPTVFNTEGGNIEITFGPQNEYSLKIPLTTKHARQNIITQLRTAADKLEIANNEANDIQKVLPFLAR
jgi:hypothetical protein